MHPNAAHTPEPPPRVWGTGGNIWSRLSLSCQLGTVPKVSRCPPAGPAVCRQPARTPCAAPCWSAGPLSGPGRVKARMGPVSGIDSSQFQWSDRSSEASGRRFDVYHYFARFMAMVLPYCCGGGVLISWFISEVMSAELGMDKMAPLVVLCWCGGISNRPAGEAERGRCDP